MKVKENQIYFKDCIEVLKSLPDRSIDLFVQDLPYGVTKNSWDKVPNLAEMWKEWLRVGKENAAFVFTAQMPFAVDLINSNRKMFRYDIIWHKVGKSTGYLNANRMPLRSHEYILVFYKRLPTYNPQKVKGGKNHSRGYGKKEKVNNNYGKHNSLYESELTELKHPTSVLAIPSDHPPVHPTEKPVDLMRWIVTTYSNEGDTVFDGYSGRGTVAKASQIEKRKFIACENKKDFFDYSLQFLKS